MTTPKTRRCDNCGNDYQYTRESSRFCSGTCRIEASRRARGIQDRGPVTRRCKNPACKATFTASGKAGKRLYCSQACKRQHFYAQHADDKAVHDHKRRGAA